jgi:hypothetical protein
MRYFSDLEGLRRFLYFLGIYTMKKITKLILKLTWGETAYLRIFCDQHRPKVLLEVHDVRNRGWPPSYPAIDRIPTLLTHLHYGFPYIRWFYDPLVLLH